MKKSIKRIVFTLILIAGCLLSVRIFFCDVYKIPSTSMKGTFEIGDYIFINKACYSSILSKPLSSINVRDNPELNEIFVFTVTKAIPGYYIKRCVGLPGSYIQIKKDMVLVDGRPLKESSTIYHYYKLWFQDFNKVKYLMDSLHIDKFQNNYRRLDKYMVIGLTNEQKGKLIHAVDSIAVLDLANETDRLKINFPEMGSMDVIIPSLIKIPSKGLTVSLKLPIPEVYYLTIRTHEDSTLLRVGDSYYRNGKIIDDYVFQHDYYFMCGDNRDVAIDSRHYGFIPRNNLIGRYFAKF